MQLSVEIKKLTVADIDQVMEIEMANFKYPWPKSFFLNDLNTPQTISLAAWREGILIGYILGMAINVELHITNVAVHLNFQRQGLGRLLISEIEKEGRRRGCHYAYLEVRVSNTPAIELYKKSGYRIVYTRKNYYLDGEDAYVMEKIL